MSAPILQVIPQRHNMDCAVACLAMLLGVSYEEALLSFRHNVIQKGATIKEIKKAAKRLGTPLQFSRKITDLESETGLLSVRSDKWPDDHIVVVKNGLIVDTDTSVWEADVYFSVNSCKPLSILRPEEL